MIEKKKNLANNLSFSITGVNIYIIIIIIGVPHKSSVILGIIGLLHINDLMQDCSSSIGYRTGVTVVLH